MRSAFFKRVAHLFRSRFSNHSVHQTEVGNPLLIPGHTVTDMKKRYLKSGLNEERLNKYEQMLTFHMQKSKVFLNSELTLDLLSSQTGIPKHHITQLLNERMKINFYGFINQYRITEAAKILKDVTRQVNLLSLAYDCGFNSKSSFNNYFKKIMDETPSSYRRKFSSPSIPAS